MTIFKGTIPVKNFFYMLYYASQVEAVRLYKLPYLGKVSTEDFDDIRDLFAAMLGENLSKQLKQGLYREYIDKTEDLSTIRGKIDITGTIRNKIARRRLLTCEFDELSENTLSNQIIKTTAMLLLRDKEVDEERKKTLRNEMRYFSNVDEILNPTTIRWSQVRFHRNNLGYRDLIFICHLILKELLLTTEDGKHVLRTFADKADRDNYMAGIYEKFVLGYYINRFSKELKVEGGKYKNGRIKWAGPKETTHGFELLPIMKTDIMLSYPRRRSNKVNKVLIIDTKLYPNIETGNKDDGGKNSIHSGNLYQIFAYVKNKDAEFGDVPHTVSGMLLYAQTYEIGEDGKPKAPLTKGSDYYPYNVGGPYNMSGNDITVRTLDLSKDFSDIEAQLDGIVIDFLFNPPALPLTSKAS